MGSLHDMENINHSCLLDRSTALIHISLGRKLLSSRVLLALTLLPIFLWPTPQSFAAKTLDQAMINQLELNCQVLAPGVFPGPPDPGLSPELNAICGTGGNAGPAQGAGGGGAGSAQSLGATVENRRLDRLEGNPNGNQATFNFPSGLGLFISGNVESLDRDKTTFGDGFDSTVWGATAGADFRFNDMFLAGTAFNYVNRDGDFDGGGGFSTNSYSVLGYGAFMPIPAMFLDVSFGYTNHNYLVDRPVSYTNLAGVTSGGTASSNSDGNEWLISAIMGYDHNISNVTIGPRVGVNYTHNKIDDYSEDGGGGLALSYDDQTVKSLQTTVGLQGSMAINTSYGVWVPQATADYIHEFKNDRRNIKVQFDGDNRANPSRFKFNNDKPDRDFFNLGIGTVLVLPNGIQPFANFRAMVGNDRFDNYAGTVGVRIEGS